MKRTIISALLAVLMSLDARAECMKVHGDTCCTEAQIADADEASDFDSPCFIPRTCAECSTDAECDALCGMKACKEIGQAGCWMPDDLNNPTTRYWKD